MFGPRDQEGSSERMNYNYGHVEPWWGEEFKFLPYENPPVNEPDVERWTAQGYDSLILHGSVYSQSQGHMPVFSAQFYHLFDWHNVGISFFRMTCGQALPPHQDQYSNYRRIFDITDPGVIRRAIIFLEDWKSGHYFEIDGKPWVDWKSGDWIAWHYDVPHYAGNFGVDARYTVQITGTIA